VAESRVRPADFQLIESYGDGGFRINGRRHQGSVIVFVERFEPWPVSAMAEATADSLVAVLTAEPPPEFLLLGCGTAMAPVDDGLRRAFASRGIVLEVMDTGAAARTYNMLLNENRRFAAALIAVS
jgi:uncharacterized protein